MPLEILEQFKILKILKIYKLSKILKLSSYRHISYITDYYQSMKLLPTEHIIHFQDYPLYSLDSIIVRYAEKQADDGRCQQKSCIDAIRALI